MTLQARSTRPRRRGLVVLSCVLAASVPSLSLVAFETVASGATSTAAAQTCNGLAAGIIGSPEVRTLRGTAANDVIVTGGAGTVEALAGDDTVCVTGLTGLVLAGAGDDHVTSDDRDAETSVLLDVGADTFVGGARRDRVTPGAGDDRVTTGAGADSYNGYAPGSAPGDDAVVELGPGNDFASVYDSNLAGVLDGGTGSNALAMHCCDEDSDLKWVVSNATETATLDGEQHFQWHRFRSFAFGEYGLSGSIEFEGTGAAEHVFAGGEFGSPDITRLDMGGGNDEVVYSRMVGPVDAGGGVDWVRLVDFADPRSPDSWASAVKVDLARDRLLVDGRAARLRDVENVEISDFVKAVLRGDGQDNQLVVGQTCVAKLYGRAGADVLKGRLHSERCPGFVDGPRAVRAFGGRGADILGGRFTADRLVGGRGRDVANGRKGVDVCVAEVRRRCER